MTKASELRSLSPDELASRLDEASKDLFAVRFQLVTGQMDNSARVPALRKEIARINTLLREAEIAAAEDAAQARAKAHAAELADRRARAAARRRGVVAGVATESRTDEVR